MKIRLKISDDLWLEEEADKEVDVFKAMSRMVEIFKKDKCGRCRSKNVRFVCRKDSQENDWLEVQCQEFSKCNAKLVYSTVKGKEGLVYPKTRWNSLSDAQKEQRANEEKWAEEHSGFLPNEGWYVYKKKDS